MGRGEPRTLIDASDEAKVSRAALEGFPQVAVLVLVGVDDFAAGENDLEVGDVVAGEATGIGVEGVLYRLSVYHHRVLV